MSASSHGTTQQPTTLDLPAPAINPYLGLILATVAVSFSAIIIKESSSPPVVIAAYRMLIATLVLAPFLRGSGIRQVRALTHKQRLLMLAAGGLLALHFAFWNASLSDTSVASSVLFVSVHPAIVACSGWALLGERLSARAGAGIFLTLVGSVIVAWGDLRVSATALHGDGLALLGAIVFAGYLLIGRFVRPALDNLSYSTPVYAVCTITLLILTFPARQSLLQVQGRDLLAFVALALVCTLGGHLMYNWTLRYLSAAVVSVSFLGEPVLAALLAWLILGQALAAGTITGGIVILSGIWLTVRG